MIKPLYKEFIVNLASSYLPIGLGLTILYNMVTTQHMSKIAGNINIVQAFFQQNFIAKGTYWRLIAIKRSDI